MASFVPGSPSFSTMTVTASPQIASSQTDNQLIMMAKQLFQYIGIDDDKFITSRFKYNNNYVFLPSSENIQSLYQYIGLYYENAKYLGTENIKQNTLEILKSNNLTNLRDLIYLLNVFNEPRRKFNIEIDNLRNVLVVQDGVYICSKCSSSKTISSSLQMASGDEASTIFIVCAACGHSWKTRG